MKETPAPPPPRTLGEIVAGVEQNAGLQDRALWSNSVAVKARFMGEDEREHVYNLDGSLLYQPPRNLRLDLRPGMGGAVMGIGSNEQDYWLWIEPELKMMRWGRHEHVGKPCAEGVPVRPDRLVAALGLCALPTIEEGLIGPARKYGEKYDILYYLQKQQSGEYLLSREYWVDRFPPYQVRLVVFRDELGRRAMSVSLDDYTLAWEGGPMVAGRVNIHWPGDEGYFTMWVDQPAGLPANRVHAKAFMRPTPDMLPGGVTDIAQVDADCD